MENRNSSKPPERIGSGNTIKLRLQIWASSFKVRVLLDGRDESLLAKSKPINERKKDDTTDHWSAIVHVLRRDWQVGREGKPDDDEDSVTEREEIDRKAPATE